MKAVTIQISDSDYADLVQHLAQDKMGRALVAVIGIAGPKGSFLERDVEAAREALVNRTVTVSKMQAAQIANKTYDGGAYSAERYGRNEWAKAAMFLAAHGFTAAEIETILGSKWMRWAADASGMNFGTCSMVKAYIKAMHGTEFREAAKMTKEAK